MAADLQSALTSELSRSDDLLRQVTAVSAELSSAAEGLSDADVVAHADTFVARFAGLRAAVAVPPHYPATAASRFDDVTRQWAAYEAHGLGATRANLDEKLAAHLSELARVPITFVSMSGSTSTSMDIPSGGIDVEGNYIWASRHNGAWEADTGAQYGITRTVSIGPSGRLLGRDAGAYLALYFCNNETINFSSERLRGPTQLSVPAGFDENECYFFWMAQGTVAGPAGHGGGLGFHSGTTRHATPPGSTFMDGVGFTLAMKRNLDIVVITGHATPSGAQNSHLIELPIGCSEDTHDFTYFWAACSWNPWVNTNGGGAGWYWTHYTPMFGVSRLIEFDDRLSDRVSVSQRYASYIVIAQRRI